MKFRNARLVAAPVPVALSVVLWGCPAWGVIVYGTQGSNDLTTTPVPETIDGTSIGDYEGTFGGFVGTPISPRFLVTATHIGTGYTSFSYANGTATTTAYPVQYVASDGDLAIYEIAPTSAATFSLYAPLYTGGSEVGQPLVVLGQGTTRGSEIAGHGWNWGGGTNAITWGTNTVAAVLTAGQGGFETPSSNFSGDFLQFTFDNLGSPDTSTSNEAIISSGDSGGGVFVLDPTTGQYELDGVNSLVDTVEDASGNPVDAALYDDNGYYTTDSMGNLVQITDNDPLSSYATRIEPRVAFIDAVTGVPEPAGAAMVLVVAPMVMGRRRRRKVPGGRIFTTETRRHGEERPRRDGI
jgi:hypothetical protein